MEGGAANEVTTPIRNRNDKGRRGWSGREEQVLAEAMEKIVREGWKSENGFKTGYLAVLANYMKEKIPNTDIKAEPHITSRITVWKRNYNTLFEILKLTGVGMDSTTNMVEATDEQWADFVKKDANARVMRHKSWPLYPDWCEIFGMSRATGEGAEDHNNAAIPPPTPEVDVDNGSTGLNEEAQGESQTPNGRGNVAESSDKGQSSSGGKKRRILTTPDPFIGVCQNFCDTASARLGEIAQRIGHEQDISSARKSIYSSIETMNMLSSSEKLRATTLIARNPENIDVFISLPDNGRLEWVLMLLRGEI